MNEDIVKKLNLSTDEISSINEAKNKVKLSKPLLIALAFSLIVFIMSYSYRFMFLPLTVSIIIIVIISLKYTKAHNIYNMLVKEIVVNKLFKQNFDNVVYNPIAGFEEAYIEDLEMISSGNIYSSNDLVSGTYKGVNFKQADVLIQTETSNGKTTTVTTNFEGRWIIVDFIKNFNGYHQVRSNGAFFANRKPGKFFGKHKTKAIKFENVEFNKQFSSYTDQEAEAFYLITPQMMEKLTMFKVYMNCEVVYGFIDNKLHVAIYNDRNAFEVDGRDVDMNFINDIQRDINLIKKVIDELDLDIDIFK